MQLENNRAVGFCVSVIQIMNFVLIYRCVKSDFLQNRQKIEIITESPETKKVNWLIWLW